MGYPFLATAATVLATSTPIVEAPQTPSPEFADEIGNAEGTATVDGTTDSHLRMTVPVTIEGEGPFQFMIDTGAQATAVTRDLSDRLELEPIGEAMVVGMASRARVDMVELDGLEFATRTLDDLEVPLLEGRHIGADGILGLDSLQDMRVLIDFRDETIAVNDAKALGGNRGYEIVVRARRKLGRLIITRAQIDGITTAVVVDTGAQNSIGNLALQRKMRARNLDTIHNTDVNGKALVGTLDFARTVRIEGMTLNNLPIVFADGPAFRSLGLDKRPAMILGMHDLRVFDRVAIDFSSKKILFDMPAGAGYRRKMRFNEFASRLKEPG